MKTDRSSRIPAAKTSALKMALKILTVASVAILLPVGTFLIVAGIMMIPPDTQGISIVEGRDLFRAHCGSCHFAKVGFPAHHGPNLHEIGRTGAHRRPGMSAPEYILESILQPAAFVGASSRPGMPKNVAAELSPDKLRNIVAFLASQGAYPDYDRIVALDIPDRRSPHKTLTRVRRQEMLRAVDVMETKARCLQCHSRRHTPESSVFAPGIFNVGLQDKQAVRQSIVTPYQEIKSPYHSASVVLKSGKVVTGRLLARNEQHLLLCVWNADGSLAVQEIPLADVEQEDDRLLIEQSAVSIMPADIDKLLTKEELQAIVTLIQQLN